MLILSSKTFLTLGFLAISVLKLLFEATAAIALILLRSVITSPPALVTASFICWEVSPPLNLTISTPNGFLLVAAAGAAPAAGAITAANIITMTNVLNHFAFINHISSDSSVKAYVDTLG